MDICIRILVQVRSDFEVACVAYKDIIAINAVFMKYICLYRCTHTNTYMYTHIYTYICSYICAGVIGL